MRNITLKLNWEFILLFILFMIVTLTHLGGNSPYSYGLESLKAGHPSMANGFPVNWDTPSVMALSRFFAFGQVDGLHIAQNNPIPIHDFLLAQVWRLTHHFFLASVILNVISFSLLLYCYCRLGRHFKLPRSVILLGGALFITLPWVAHFVSQPQQYMLAVSIYFIVICGLLFTPKCLVNPVKEGFIFGVLYLIYDPYAYLIAFGIFVLFTKRYHATRGYLLFVLSLLLPVSIWHWIMTLSPVELSDALQKGYYMPILMGWLNIFLYLPLLSIHNIVQIGLVSSFKQILSQLYWPLLGVGLFYIWKIRKEALTVYKKQCLMAISLVLGYVIIQIISSAFDFDNNPRRAFPVVIAFFLVLLPALKELVREKWQRVTSYLLAMLGFIYCMADQLFDYPNISLLFTGQYIYGDLKLPLNLMSSGLGTYLYKKSPIDFIIANADSFPNLHLTTFWVLSTIYLTILFTIVVLLIISMYRNIFARADTAVKQQSCFDEEISAFVNK